MTSLLIRIESIKIKSPKPGEIGTTLPCLLLAQGPFRPKPVPLDMAYYLVIAAGEHEHVTKPCPDHTDSPNFEPNTFEFELKKGAPVDLELTLGRGNETISIAELPVNAAAMPEDIEGILAKETDAFSIALGVTKLGKSKKALKSKKYEPKEKARRRGGISPSNSYVATFKDKEKDKEKRKRAVSLGPEIPLEKSTSKKLLEVPEDQPVKGSPSPNSSPSLTDSPTSSSPAKSKKSATDQLSAKMERQRKRLSISLGLTSHKPVSHETTDLEEVGDDPKDWVVHLGKRPPAEFYDKLVLTLRVKDDAWIESFCKLGAIALLVVPMIERLESDWLNDVDLKLVTSIVQVLISIMQDANGFKYSMSCRETPHALLLCIARPELISSYKKMIVKLLTFGMNLSETYHTQIERAMVSGSMTYQRPESVSRFLWILAELDETRDLEYKTLLLAFLYTLVNYSSDLESRVKLRAELEAVDFSALLTELADLNVMDVGTGAFPIAKLNQILQMLYYQVERHRRAQRQDELELQRRRMSHVSTVDSANTLPLLRGLARHAERHQLTPQLRQIANDLLTIDVSGGESSRGYAQWFLTQKLVHQVAMASRAGSGGLLNGVHLETLLTSAPTLELLQLLAKEHRLLHIRDQVKTALLADAQNARNALSALLTNYLAMEARNMVITSPRTSGAGAGSPPSSPTQGGRDVREVLAQVDQLLDSVKFAPVTVSTSVANTAASSKRTSVRFQVTGPEEDAAIKKGNALKKDLQDPKVSAEDFEQRALKSLTAELASDFDEIIGALETARPPPLVTFAEERALFAKTIATLRAENALLREARPAEPMSPKESAGAGSRLNVGSGAGSGTASPVSPLTPHSASAAASLDEALKAIDRGDYDGVRDLPVQALRVEPSQFKLLDKHRTASPVVKRRESVLLDRSASASQSSDDFDAFSAARVPVLNWTPLPAERIAGTMFEDLDSDSSSPVRFDYFDITQKFGRRRESVPTDGSSSDGPSSMSGYGALGLSGGSERAPAPEPILFSILHPTHSRALEDILRAMRWPKHTAVCEDLATFRSENFSLSLMDALIKALPTSDDLSLYHIFKKSGTPSELDQPSRFALALHQVPQVALRARVLRFDIYARETTQALYGAIAAVQRANKALATERRFKQLFKIVLDLGNGINSGKKWIGGVHGFYLPSVLALADIRANDDSCSLLEYILKTVEQQRPDLLRFDAKLKRAFIAVFDIDADDLVERLSRLRSEFALARELAAQVENKGSRDTFGVRVKQRWTEISGDLAELEQALEVAIMDYRRLARHFGESGRSSALGEFYRFFHAFLVAKEYSSLHEDREEPFVAPTMDEYFQHLNELVNKKQTRAEQRRSMFMLMGASHQSVMNLLQSSHSAKQ